MKNALKSSILALSFSVLLSACGGNGSSASSTGWTWISGSKTAEQAGVYGTQGAAASLNVPGARFGSVSWMDAGGKLWLFGGYGADSAGHHGALNDLWKFDPAASQWTWVSGSNVRGQAGAYGTQGVPAPSNAPGARLGSVSWIDAGGKLWLFGGLGFDSAGITWGQLNDLWQYDPATSQWTWVSGSSVLGQAGAYGTQGVPSTSNGPGSRTGSVSWIDASGKLWLFGGLGLDSTGTNGNLNDLWKYDPATLEWTWASGSHVLGQSGAYGTKGITAPTNVPGARSLAVSWIDTGGRLWLFGGSGVDSAGAAGDLNDLWKFDPATLEWTWVSGGNVTKQPGSYGTKGTPASANVPGERESAIAWIDSSGSLWLFGGFGAGSAGSQDDLNDLWKYDPATSQWTWVSGSNTVNQAGAYGTQGTTGSSNIPGARARAVSWIDTGGKLWLFGGSGLDSASTKANLNDLWHYTR